jgi:hypothetical protein
MVTNLNNESSPASEFTFLRCELQLATKISDKFCETNWQYVSAEIRFLNTNYRQDEMDIQKKIINSWKRKLCRRIKTRCYEGGSLQINSVESTFPWQHAVFIVTGSLYKELSTEEWLICKTADHQGGRSRKYDQVLILHSSFVKWIVHRLVREIKRQFNIWVLSYEVLASYDLLPRNE